MNIAKGSSIAKGGYAEEVDIANELNTNAKLKSDLSPILGDAYDTCKQNAKKGTKCDIISANGMLRAQNKKGKKNVFQQVDRHTLEFWLEKIPEMKRLSDTLSPLFELPILSDGIHVDKSQQVKKLTRENYSQEHLDLNLKIFNENKRAIIEEALLGSDEEHKPEYLIYNEYSGPRRQTTTAMRYSDIVDYLSKLPFIIAPKKTSFILEGSPFQIMRKGGDGGRKSSNNVQIKLTPSKLISKVPTATHHFID